MEQLQNHVKTRLLMNMKQQVNEAFRALRDKPCFSDFKVEESINGNDLIISIGQSTDR